MHKCGATILITEAVSLSSSRLRLPYRERYWIREVLTQLYEDALCESVTIVIN